MQQGRLAAALLRQLAPLDGNERASLLVFARANLAKRPGLTPSDAARVIEQALEELAHRESGGTSLN